MSGDTIPGHLARAASERANETAYLGKANGIWSPLSWRDHAARCRTIARALVAAGVMPGDRVAILSETRLEWVQCDVGITCAGGVTVGIYPASVAEECAYIIDHCDAAVLFVENPGQLEKLAKVRARMPRLARLILLEGEAAGPGVIRWSEFLAGASTVPPEAIDARIAQLRPDDLASIVYTSGTTGTPKGVMLSHRNVLFAAESAAVALDLGTGRSFLLCLPLAHVFARLTVHLCMVTGNVIVIAESIARVAENMKQVRPHYLAAVPRLYEKIHDRILGDVRRAGGSRRAIFQWALDVGMRAAALERAAQPVPWKLRAQRALARRLVFRKLHEALGGRIRYLISGAAPLDPRIAEFFHAFGILILEGIGMTENSSFTHVNRRGRFRFGTVGLPGPGIETRIAADGEVLIRGANVMRGYHKDPAATAAAIDPEGWLATGDIGTVDADGFLTITDRKKDLIITSGGKNIAPSRVERAVAESPYIAQVVVFGDRRKYLAALVVPDFDAVRAWAAERGQGGLSAGALAASPEVVALLESEVGAANRNLASFETVKQIRVLPAELTIERGELTPTMKVRRKTVAENYHDLIESMYED